MKVDAYIPLQGFVDLREYAIPQKEFKAFVRIQKFLFRWEKARESGRIVPDKIRDLSAQYQQSLFQYPQIGGLQ